MKLFKEKIFTRASEASDCPKGRQSPPGETLALLSTALAIFSTQTQESVPANARFPEALDRRISVGLLTGCFR